MNGHSQALFLNTKTTLGFETLCLSKKTIRTLHLSLFSTVEFFFSTFFLQFGAVVGVNPSSFQIPVSVSLSIYIIIYYYGIVMCVCVVIIIILVVVTATSPATSTVSFPLVHYIVSIVYYSFLC